MAAQGQDSQLGERTGFTEEAARTALQNIFGVGDYFVNIQQREYALACLRDFPQLAGEKFGEQSVAEPNHQSQRFRHPSHVQWSKRCGG